MPHSNKGNTTNHYQRKTRAPIHRDAHRWLNEVKGIMGFLSTLNGGMEGPSPTWVVRQQTYYMDRLDDLMHFVPNDAKHDTEYPTLCQTYSNLFSRI